MATRIALEYLSSGVYGLTSARRFENGSTMKRRSIGARWAARAGLEFGLAAALASGCGDDEAEPVLVPDSATLGELSSAQMKSLCDESRAARASQRSASCIPPDVIGSSTAMQANSAPCDLESIACDVTAGEVRACERAQRADVCNGGHEAIGACAPFIQRGCVAAGSGSAWTDACPDLAADVAPFEGIYELSRHTVNETSCDAEGASVLETNAQRLFVVVTIMLDGAPIGRMDRCDDLEHCRGVADSLRRYSQRTDPARASSDTESRMRQLLCHPTIEGALESQHASAATIPQEGRCDLEQTQEVITRAQDGTLRLEGRTRAWQQPPEDGFCPSLSRPDGPVPPDVGCSRLQVYEARLVSAL